MSQKNPLQQLHDLGQSFWWDTLSRRHIDDGTLVRMRDENDMRGITSNPSIFQAAIAKSHDYDDAIAKLSAEGMDTGEIFWAVAVQDIVDCCDLLRPVYERSHGEDGFVSLEVDPRLAADTEGTLRDARELWQRVNRPNLMIKIPATLEGVPAIGQALAEGINVNVTLLFSPEVHVEVMKAYLDAMDQRLEQGLPLDGVASVASFFVSRVDGLVDAKLKSIGSEDAAALMGKAAIANARVAYAHYQEIFSGPRWQKLADAGAKVQRPLWASTSTKDPSYPDVLYVETLIGPDTVNTLPTVTVEAFADHGRPQANTVIEGLGESRQDLEGLASLGIDMGAVTDELLEDGVRKFEQSFEELLSAVEEKAGKSGK